MPDLKSRYKSVDLPCHERRGASAGLRFRCMPVRRARIAMPRAIGYTGLMKPIHRRVVVAVLAGWVGAGVSAPAVELDERPVEPGEWGYRPAENQSVAANPPSFSWRPQPGVTWELECTPESPADGPVYRVGDLTLNVFCPPRTFPPGVYTWRYRAVDATGATSAWSRVRGFLIPPEAAAMPMPTRAELLARVPETHPRLFVRPEQVEPLRAAARDGLRERYQSLVAAGEDHLRKPADLTEPPTYPTDGERKSEAWRSIWWGNRGRVQRALGSAATLGFTWRIGGDERFGLEARRILMACAKWDPRGSTGYRYNDEAGMPYAYYFARTYTFIHPLLTEDERALCQRVMKARGDEMYAHLHPRHLWRPYSSHSNRAWHFLGEVALAFFGEVEGADDWLWFAMNVFYNAYPVWSDADGGWHEGMLYWNSYQARFTWWADVMREVLGIDAFDKPYYSRVGFYPMYVLPPGKTGAGFGDLNAPYRTEKVRDLMGVLAAQARNPYWQWYVEALGGARAESSMIGFVRGALPAVPSRPPDDLPSSRLFLGTGQAALNTQIHDAADSVQVLFKSSPFGTQSHGYEANNSFLLWGYGQRVLIRSGYRDIYASDHHRNWMWSTRSVNNITVNGKGQRTHSAEAQGHITDFVTTPTVDVVVGEAGAAYDPPLERFSRALVFVKPDLLIVYDRLSVAEPSSFQYHLHALSRMTPLDEDRILVREGQVVCRVEFLTPTGLRLEQTDQYDPNPRPRIKLREWHLTATPTEPAADQTFVTLYRIHRNEIPVEAAGSLEEQPGGYVLTASAERGRVTVLLPRGPDQSVRAEAGSTTGHVRVWVEDGDRSAIDLTVDGIVRDD